MKLGSHLLIYAPVNLVRALAAFGGVYVFTRLLSGPEYGRYALMFSVMALVHGLSLTWVEASSYRFTGSARADGRLSDHFRNAIVLTSMSLIVALALLGILLIIVWPYPEYRLFVPVIALLLPVNTIVKVSFEVRRASQQAAHYAMAITTKIGLGFAVGVLLAWQSDLGALSPMVGLLFAALCLLAIEGKWLWQQAQGGVSRMSERRAWIGYGVPTAIALSLDLLLSSADRFLISFFLGEEAVGAYAAGYGVADKTVLLICAWAALAASPLIMAAYEESGQSGAQKEARGLITALLLLGAPAATGLALVATPLAEVMIGEALRDQASRIIPLIAFSGLLNGLLIHYVAESFQLKKKTTQRAVLMIVPVLMNIGLNFVLIPKFGIMGAVYATLLSYTVALILLGVAGRRLVALPVPVGDAARIALACLAMWLVVQQIPELGGWLELLSKVMAGALVYAAVVLALNISNARSVLALLAKRLER